MNIKPSILIFLSKIRTMLNHMFDHFLLVTPLHIPCAVFWALVALPARQDVLCTFSLQGQAFAIGSDNALVDGDVNAFDHNVTSVWTALCASDVGKTWRIHDVKKERRGKTMGYGTQFF